MFDQELIQNKLNQIVEYMDELDRDLFIRKLKQNFSDFKQYTVFIEQAMEKDKK